MKCPKCGYNSFEYYDSCKKCSADLVAFKNSFSISSIVLPQEAKEILTGRVDGDIAPDMVAEQSDIHDDVFSFDLPGDTQEVVSSQPDNPFAFVDSPFAGVGDIPVPPQVQDAFANLAGGAEQETSPFDFSATAAPTADFASSEPDEFDFSWDAAPAISGAVPQPVAEPASDSSEDLDDFDSLFGSPEEKVQGK